MLLSRITVAILFTGACIAGSAACGNSNADNRNFGAPPNPSDFNPGDNTGGNGGTTATRARLDARRCVPQRLEAVPAHVHAARTTTT